MLKPKIIILSLMATSSVFANDCSPSSANIEIKQAVKWYRDSAEQKALYYQVFNTGSKYINNWKARNKPKAHSWGIVLDIDETTLDNSWYFKQCTDLADEEDDFSHYVAIPEKSVALPGVVKLTCAVQKSGGYVSLVSNRDGSFTDKTGKVLDATIANLKQQGVCFDQVVLANRKDSKTPSDKNPRFQAINSGKYDATQLVWSNELPAHKVIAYFGDNIQDFPKFKQAAMYALPSEASEFDIFANGYFILPNPMYGSWGKSEYK